jgi:hypothetical protein
MVYHLVLPHDRSDHGRAWPPSPCVPGSVSRPMSWMRRSKLRAPPQILEQLFISVHIHHPILARHQAVFWVFVCYSRKGWDWNQQNDSNGKFLTLASPCRNQVPKGDFLQDFEDEPWISLDQCWPLADSIGVALRPFWGVTRGNQLGLTLIDPGLTLLV